MGTVRPIAEPIEPKSRLGRVLRERWRVDELVWSTPSSSLYWATHRTGTRAAIRVLAPELSANPARASLFLETASIVQSIAHDGAVRILDDDRDQDGCVFLVLELFDAISLRTMLDGARDPMTLEEAARIGVGILEVLAAAHHAGVQHGALRAEDVFVTRQGHVKLLGFEGRAPELEGGPNFRRDTSAVGTLLYTMLAAAPPRGHSLAIARPDLPPWLVDVTDRALGFGTAAPWADGGAMLAAMLTTYRPPTPLDAFEPQPLPGVPQAPDTTPQDLTGNAGQALPPGSFHSAALRSTQSQSPGSFVAFPVTDDMNPLFVQAAGTVRPLAPRPTTRSGSISSRARPLLTPEASFHRQRRRRALMGIALLALGVVSVLIAVLLRQS